MIKIINGTYGYREGTQIIPKNADSEPFSVGVKEEARLVKLGVAEYVDDAPAQKPAAKKSEAKAQKPAAADESGSES